MKVLIKILIGIIVLIALIYFIAIPYVHNEAKKFSPEKTATLDLGDNEPTTFTTTKQIKIIDKTLPAGRYSLWTIPNKDSWKVIFNTKIPEWGVTRVDGNQTTHKAKYDYLTIEVPTKKLEEPVEDLSINFEDIEINNKTQNNLSLAWDTTKIMVPLYK